MAGARTEAGPTAAEADIRTGAAPMGEAGRTVQAVAEATSAQGGRVQEAVAISVAAGAAADSAAGGRREIRRWRGRVAARTQERRHARPVVIRRACMAAEVTGVQVAVTAADTTAGRMVLADRVIAAVDTATTGLAAVDRVMAETADLTVARDKAGRTAMGTATIPTGIRAPDVAVTDRLRIAAIRE
jgi:hypothetical protein